MSRLVKGLVIVLLATVALLISLALAAETTWFAQFVARQASDKLHRQVTIDGPLDIDWSLHPRIQLPALTIANAPWAGQQPLAQIANTQFTLSLSSLLGGHVVIDNLLLHAPRLDLQRLGDGRSNWQELLGDQRPAGGGPAITVDTVQIRNGRLSLQDAGQALQLEVAVDTTPAENRPERLHVAGHGSRHGHAFELDVRGGPLLAVTSPSQPYPIAGTLRSGKTSLKAAGELLRPAAPERGQFTLALKGPNPADLHELLGLTLPDLPPYQLQGQLSFENNVWHFRQLSGTVGDSDLAGELLIKPGQPLVLEAELVSKRLDLDDLLPAVGAAPASGKGETASAQQKQQAKAQKQDEEALPRAPP